MSSLMIPIKPKWFDLIASGKKTVEVRKVMPARKIDKLIFYITAPISKVVGECEVTLVEKQPANIFLLQR